MSRVVQSYPSTDSEFAYLEENLEENSKPEPVVRIDPDFERRRTLGLHLPKVDEYTVQRHGPSHGSGYRDFEIVDGRVRPIGEYRQLVKEKNPPPAEIKEPKTSDQIPPYSVPVDRPLDHLRNTVGARSGDNPPNRKADIPRPHMKTSHGLYPVQKPESKRLRARTTSIEFVGQNTTDDTDLGAKAREPAPTCSLELICYRSSVQGCARGVILVGKGEVPKRWKVGNREYTVITEDSEIFKEIRRVYEKEMCGFWRRWFSLTKVKCIRLLQCIEDSRPSVLDSMDAFEQQELMYLYYHPSKAVNDGRYIDWVFRLRQPDHRHALEFVEGWSSLQIAVFGSLPAVISTAVGIVWSVRTGDIVTAFSVAVFILTAGTLLIALLGVISSIST